MQNGTKDSPGVVAPPPLIFLSGILLGAAVHWFSPLYIFPAEYASFFRVFGGFLIAFGLVIIFIAKTKMQRAQTNIEPWKPTNAIITDGIYSVSRNPIYVAMIAIYLGVTMIFNSLWFPPFLIVVLFVMHFGVIRREENYLEKKFGAPYLDYKQQVRRWI